jgi:hypothetical protein
MGAVVKPRLDFGDTSPENSLMHSAIAARKPDFSGWATKANLECADGRTILTDAFAHQDGQKVPMVWQHGHDDPENVLGHMILEQKDGSTRAHGYFNNTPKAKVAKELVEHGDIDSLSIFANKLKEVAKKVSHGLVREISLVMARANPGAVIDNIELKHSDGEMVTLEDEAIIFTGEKLMHGDGTEIVADPVIEHNELSGPEVQAQFDSMTPEQKEAVTMIVGAAIEHTAANIPADDKAALIHSGTDPKQKETRTMSRNVFDQSNKGATDGVPEHKRVYVPQEHLKQLMHDAMRPGNTLKGVVEDYAIEHGIDNIDVLFPEARAVAERPEFDARRVEWVKGVMAGTRKTPFSRIKSMYADITHDEARARGYIKASFKKEEFFGLASRKTTPTTVYKKQKLDRDDIIDIVDFDVVAWMKAEMRVMLEEEIARAILISDGRAIDDEDKIKDPAGSNEGEGIRSILNDHDLYARKVNIPVDDANFNGSAFIDEVVMAMGQYKGTGRPTLYTTQQLVTRLLLMKDTLGRRLYSNKAEVANAMTVESIVEVEVMESNSNLLGIIVNLSDYALGADRGGDVAMFDDFDIDYNQLKYLIETRLSGALIKIRAAIVLMKIAAASTKRVPPAPTFNAATGEITVPNQTGVSYRRADTQAVVSNTVIELDPYQELTIVAVPTANNYIDVNAETEWTFRNGRQYTGRDSDMGTPPGSTT